MLRQIIENLLTGVFRLSPETKLYGFAEFFLYDSVKIILLLFFVISALGFLRSFIPRQRVKKWLSGNKLFAHFAAALLGALTPFCSCSGIPIFFGFIETGVPLGISFSFLITSPIINEYLVVLMLGFFGIKVAVLYVVFGMFIGITLGMLLGKMKLERHLVSDIVPDNGKEELAEVHGLKGRIVFGINEALDILRKLWFWILVGIAIGALIHNFVPREFIQEAITKTGIFSVPLAVVLGVPLYGSCAAIVPIAVALFNKGVPLGTALAFMTAVSALSLPEAIILRRAMKLKLIAIFFGTVTLSIILVGYVFNFIAKF